MASGWTGALEPRPLHEALGAAIVDLARAAGARLAARDAASGFLTLSSTQRTTLASEGEHFTDRCGAMLEAWDVVAAAPTGQAMARVGRIAATQEERVLLALLVAGELERAIGKALRFCAAPDGRLSVGALLDLASSSPLSRQRLAGLLHPAAALRGQGLLEVDRPGAAAASSLITVTGPVLAAVRGEPVGPPDVVDALAHRPEPGAAALLDRCGLRGCHPGGVTVLSGPRPRTLALAHLALLARGRAAWMVAGAPAATTSGWWRTWASHATLADVALVVAVEGAPLDQVTVIARTIARATDATIVLLTDASAPAVDGESLTVVPCAPVVEALLTHRAEATGLVRRVLDALAGTS